MVVDEYGSPKDPAVILLAPMMVSGSDLYELMSPYFTGTYYFIAPDQGGHGKAGSYKNADDEYRQLKAGLLEKGIQKIDFLYAASLGVAVAWKLFSDPAFEVRRALKVCKEVANVDLVRWPYNKRKQRLIQLRTGAIRARDFDCEFYAPTAVTTANNASSVSGITQDQALEIALKHAELSKADVSHTHVHQDFDDGMEQFDVTFYVGMTEYNYDIDANTGTIVDFEAEIDD